MRNMCDDHCWSGNGECPQCEVAFRDSPAGPKPEPVNPKVFGMRGSPELEKALADLAKTNLVVTLPRQSKDPLGPNYWPERHEEETLEEYQKRVRKLRRLLQPATSMYTADTVENLLAQFDQSKRDDFVCALREVVKSPSVGGSGQYLGSLTPLVFATKEQKLQAVLLMERWAWDSENK